MLGLKIWQTAMEHTVSITVMMFDIDLFKSYNDRFGHQAGDDLLHFIGTDLKKRVRTETDLIGRYGGEEFLIIMYNLLPEKATQIAEGIRKRVEPSDNNTFRKMIHKADCALYRAKQTGRNKVVLYDPTMEQVIDPH